MPIDKERVEREFSDHISAGQLGYLRAGHLDVIESERRGIGFVDSASGRPMIDAFTSAGCFNVGRRNPAVLKALDEALENLDMGSPGLASAAKLEFARRLTALAPGDLDRIVFACGGGDAVDGAIKLARAATGRAGVIATLKGYHGHTGFALSANGKEHYRGYAEPLMAGFDFVPFNDLEAVRREASETTAAIIVEPVQGEAGIFVGSDDYLRGLRELCERLGIVLIFDEIQTGFGRTGRMFASQHSGVVPDIMTVAKSLGGGLYPSAAILYRPLPILNDYVASNPGFHPTIGGGCDIAARVSAAVIEQIESLGLVENAERQGRRLKTALEDLAAANPRIIREVRGIGLMVGVEYIHEFMGPLMSDALARRGMFAAYSGNAPQVMRFMLPLTVSDDEMGRVIDAIAAALGDMKRVLPLALTAARIPGVLGLLNNQSVQTRLFGLLRRFEDMFSRARGGGVG